MHDGHVSSAGRRPNGLRSTVGRAMGDPVARNGLVLAGTSAVTAVLGLAFWALAARLSTPAEVGQAAVTITVLNLIANIAGLSLTSSFSYLLPRLRSSRRRFLTLCFLLTGAAALVLAGGFLAVAASARIAPLDFLVSSPTTAVMFLVAAPAFVLFHIHDGALIGLRRPLWVLGENTTFALMKLCALLAFGLLALDHAIALAWIVSTLVIVPIVTALIFGRLVPPGSTAPDLEHHSPRVVRRFVGLQYLGLLLGQSYLNTLPVIVTLLAGSTAGGFFYLPWTIAITVDMLSHGFGASLTVEGASNPARLAAHLRTVSLRLGMLLGAGAVVGLVLAPEFLLIYGQEYAANSSLLLRLFIVGALFRAIVIVAQSATRARGHTRLTLVSESLTCLVVLGTSIALLPIWGVDAVGWAWLVGNAVVGLAALPTVIRMAGAYRPQSVRLRPTA